jgi:hypothetical protein
MEIIDSKSLSENDWMRRRMHGTKTREVPSANSKSTGNPISGEISIAGLYSIRGR